MSPWESIDYVSEWTKEHRAYAGASQTEVAKRASELMKAAGSSKTLKQQSIDQLEKRDHKGVPDWFRFVREAIQNLEDENAPRPGSMGPAATSVSKVIAPEPDIPPVLPDDIEMIREVDIRYAMGDGALIADFPEVGQMPFNRSFRRALTQAPAEVLFIARGDGDSMLPTLINDDAVLIDTSQTRITQSDRIWALRIEDAGLIKRVRVLPKVGYELLSDNPMVPPQIVSREDLSVVGRVIWVGRRV